jgi:hypothetical protein
MNTNRLKRSTQERYGPIRNALVPRAATPGGPPGGHVGGDGTARPASSTAEKPGGLKDALECGVRTAYTVIDQYIQRGYEAARASQDSPKAGGHMNNRPNYSGWQNPWGSAAGPMEQWVAAARAWTEMWMAFAPGMRGGQWPNPSHEYAGGTHSPGGQVPPISVCVMSQRPTEVEAYFTPGAGHLGRPLVADVHDLKGLSIEPQGGKVLLTLEVAADQKEGDYHGCIRAGNEGRDVGHIAVRIMKSPAKSV